MVKFSVYSSTCFLDGVGAAVAAVCRDNSPCEGGDSTGRSALPFLNATGDRIDFGYARRIRLAPPMFASASLSGSSSMLLPGPFAGTSAVPLFSLAR